ncbi:hypothetical protein DVK00_18785 [Haloarcula sp. Atlit-47R]|uniref:ATP-binding protein n=1 Tax=Haloarcula sp. Atlit-47R TaxID=2282132 RepID=UPI000EF26F16|nr:ATP-binding protein [Haloarcula sp. Atlit-47R]RLM41888.1 hypothetical protein DVK00_18785 [Haloarcula sp. Atlit-47R]
MSDSSESYDLKPSKEAYQAVKSDVTPVSAFKELIDNALDNWMRVSQRLDDITIEIEYYDGGPDGQDRVVIRDDTGGVGEDDVRILFALGQSKKSNITGSIGAYGIGAKKAIVNLGNEADIRSRALDTEEGYGFTIDQEWLEDDDDWSVDKQVYTDIDEGVTEIEVRDLNIDWEDYADDLEDDLAQTYQRFLDGTYDQERGDLDIVIKEYEPDQWETSAKQTIVTAPEPVEWSFVPIDGFQPRRFENIKLQSKEFDTVHLHVTVGLMQGSDSSISGADIFCQDRKVLSAVRDDRAGFGTGAGSNRLGNFSNQHHRLKVLIEFETDGDASDLPWDAQKSDIDQYNRVAQAAYSWIRRIVKPYHKAAGNYEDFPSAFLEPYDRDSPYAETENLDDPHDYGDRERVMHKPDTDMPTAKKIGQRAAVSKTIEVYAPGDLEDKYIPAFESELARLYNKDHEDVDIKALPEAEGLPSFDVEEAENMVDELRQEAESHLADGKRATDLPDWQQTIYNQILEELLEADTQELAWEDLEPLEAEQESAISPENGTEETDEESTGTAGMVSPDETDVESTGEDMAGGSLFGDESDTGEQATEEVAQEMAQEVTEDLGEDEETAEKVQETIQEQMEEFTESMNPEGVYTLRLPQDDWSELTDALGLADDATEEEVREELLSTMELLRQLRSPQ